MSGLTSRLFALVLSLALLPSCADDPPADQEDGSMLGATDTMQVDTDYHLQPGQTPTALSVTNADTDSVYANLVLGQPPASPPDGCSSLGTQIESVSDSMLVFASSLGRTVAFAGPTGVTTKGAYVMAPGETITYQPQTVDCFSGETCSPALTANFFFTSGFNGTTNGNNGCSDPTYFPNASNLAEASINFGANGAVGTTCANADDTDISAVNGVNARLAVNTTDAGTGAAWPASTSLAENGPLGSNLNSPGVFGWAATNCTNSDGYPNPAAGCDAPVDAPTATNGACTAPATLIPGTDYCAQTSAEGTCNNQRAGFNTGGTVVITYNGQIAPTNL